MDDAKKGLNTQIEYRCKMYKSMHEEIQNIGKDVESKEL